MDPTELVVLDRLKSFLAEDLGHGDITTDALINPQAKAIAHVICHEPAVVAGLQEASLMLQLVRCSSNLNARDGDRIESGTKILRINGPAHSILTVERTLLNLVSHMSGVATATAELVRLAKRSGSTVRIACTRKTLPGLRYFEKRAVELGGGDSHRLRLDDAVLIKDNHLAIAGSLADSIGRARSKVSFTKKIEAEVTKPNQAVEAAQAGADIVLLDNMRPEEVENAVALLKTSNLRSRVLLEASGGITRENLPDYANTGVDVISVGRITHSARSIDMSLELSTRRGDKIHSVGRG